MRITNEKAISTINKEKEAAKAPVLTIGQQVSQIKISDIQKDTLIKSLGQQVTLLKIEVMKLKGAGN